jgi:hypothetical protein
MPFGMYIYRIRAAGKDLDMNRAAPAISDEAVRSKTGKTWAQWFDAISAAGGMDMNHRRIVAWLAEHHELSPWWRQMVAVTYEQAMGLRDRHQKPDGYQISVSRTMPAAVSDAYSAWSDGRRRRVWLLGSLKVSTATENRSLRGAWADGGRVEIRFTPKGPRSCQVQVQHGKLPDAGTAASRKAFWKEQLQALAEYLAGLD